MKDLIKRFYRFITSASSRQEMAIYALGAYNGLAVLGDSNGSWPLALLGYGLSVLIGYMVVDYINMVE